MSDSTSSFSLTSNYTASVAMRGLRNAGRFFADTAERLATGLRVNKGADGAADLHISEKLRAQIYGLARAAQNSQDGSSLLQTAEGALDEIQSMLHRMRELAVQGATDTASSVDRSVLSAEMRQLTDQMTAIARTTTFNGQVLLDGSLGAAGRPLSLQVGPSDGNLTSIVIEAVDATSLGVAALPTGAHDAAHWSDFIVTVDAATNQLSSERGLLADQQGELSHFVLSLNVALENSRAADSRSRDTDFGLELLNYNRGRLLKEPSMAAIVHSNLMAETALAMYDTVRQPGQR